MPAASKVVVIAAQAARAGSRSREFLLNKVGCPVFVNADLIAAGLASFALETAAVQTDTAIVGSACSTVRHAGHHVAAA